MWYIIFNGQQVGPLNADQLRDYNLTPQSMVWKEGMPDWMRAGNIPELSYLFQPGGSQVPPRPGYGYQGYGEAPYNGGEYYPGRSDKSKTTAGVLALLLGGLGIQYFYLGKTGGGLLTILLTVVTCGAWELVTFIQGILMLCMSDEEFDRKYVYSDKTMPLF